MATAQAAELRVHNAALAGGDNAHVLVVPNINDPILMAANLHTYNEQLKQGHMLVFPVNDNLYSLLKL